MSRLTGRSTSRVWCTVHTSINRFRRRRPIRITRNRRSRLASDSTENSANTANTTNGFRGERVAVGGSLVILSAAVFPFPPARTRRRSHHRGRHHPHTHAQAHTRRLHTGWVFVYYGRPYVDDSRCRRRRQTVCSVRFFQPFFFYFILSSVRAVYRSFPTVNDTLNRPDTII